LQLTQSTSPSYLLLASLDAARHQMAMVGPVLLGAALDLMAEMRAWAAENKKDIKMAAKPFKDKIDSISASFQQKIADQAFEEAKVFIQAFRAVGTASRVLEGMTA
jgi:arginine/lysine/ornithine decarboxylase